MIVKGTAIKSQMHAAYLANHLLNPIDNEKCEVWDIDGHATPDDLRAALSDYYEMVKLTKGRTGLFMISLNPEKSEKMTVEQVYEAIKKAEKVFNLEGQPKAIVRHHKENRSHVHVVWQTTDVEQKKNCANLFYSHRKCMGLARDLEIELGHKAVSNEKSNTSFSEKERAQVNRLGKDLSPTERKKQVQQIFKNSKDSVDFAKQVKAAGFTVAQGKVGVCLVDDTGQVYNLEKELKGQQTQKELKDFFKNHPEKLPNASRQSNDKNKEKKAEKRNKKGHANDNLSDSQKRAYYLIYDHEYREQQKNGLDISSSVDASEKDATTQTAEQAGANIEDTVLDKKALRKQQLLDNIAKQKEQDAAGNKKTFREKLQDAQDNLRSDKDIGRENDLLDKFRKNSLEILFLPILLSAKLLAELADLAFRFFKL
jgi:hypothetical protein